MRLRNAAVLAVAGALIALVSIPSAAQDWPTRPVRVIAPFAPGGTADTLGRIVSEQLGEKYGQQFVVENRGGAGGLIGSAAVAHADPDGYTFVISGIASHVIAPSANANPGFDPVRDFSHIAYLGGPPIVLVVNPSLGARDLQGLIALAKASAQPLGYVSPGAGTLGNLVAEVLARKADIKLEHIPYKGAAQAITDLIAGHVRMGAMTWTTALAQIRAKTVVPIAVSASRRLKEFPEVPTLKELGYPDLVATTWFAFSGPAGVPRPIVQKLNADIIKAMDSAAVQARLEQEAIETEPMSPDEFTKFVADEIARWGPFAKALGK